jgi:hypothetical protein
VLEDNLGWHPDFSSIADYGNGGGSSKLECRRAHRTALLTGLHFVVPKSPHFEGLTTASIQGLNARRLLLTNCNCGVVRIDACRCGDS